MRELLEAVGDRTSPQEALVSAPTLRVAIFGLGYVGSVSMGCLARLGHETLGVDVNGDKVAQIASGRSPIAEHGLEDLISAGVESGKLRATCSAASAVAWADVSLVCVGTPSRPNGSLDTGYVERVVCEIGMALRERRSRHAVIIRSTLLPGTTVGTLQPLLEAASGKRCGSDMGLAYNPEFLREGTAVRDFDSPPYTVIGAIDDASFRDAARVYAAVDAPIERVSVPEAEMIKYAANAFHAAKITFANEIGNFCKRASLDSHRVMEVIARDTKLNISSAYLKPGYAYGGSCLPKDLRAILYAARQSDVDLPMLQSLPVSNARQVQRGIDAVLETGSRKIGILGFSFKAGTDDLRESPMVQLIEALLGKGFDLRLYDKNVSWARIAGANRQYIEAVVPHLADLMVESIDEVVAHADVLVIGNNSHEFTELLTRPVRQVVVDLVRLPGISEDRTLAMQGRYRGICW